MQLVLGRKGPANWSLVEGVEGKLDLKQKNPLVDHLNIGCILALDASFVMLNLGRQAQLPRRGTLPDGALRGGLT